MEAKAVTGTKAPTPLQASIIATKHEHPDLSTRDIAKLNDTVHSHVVRTLTEYGIETERIERYKSARADILAGIQERVIRTKFGTDSDVKSMPDAAAILLFNSCFNNERLERGQATEISVNFDALKAMQDRQKELADKIRALEHGEVIEIEPGPQDVVSPPGDNDAPNHNYAESLSVPNKRASDKRSYVNHEEGKAQSQGTRRGRPRKGR